MIKPFAEIKPFAWRCGTELFQTWQGAADCEDSYVRSTPPPTEGLYLESDVRKLIDERNQLQLDIAEIKAQLTSLKAITTRMCENDQNN